MRTTGTAGQAKFNTEPGTGSQAGLTPPPSPFVLRLEAEDGTITDVAVDFDFTDFTVDEHKWVIAQPPDELIPACLYVKVARQAPDLPYEMLKDALLEVTRAGRMEVIGGRP